MDDLHAKVKGWLQREGYPLEFVAAHAFEKADFRTSQGTYIAAPGSGNYREIDVIASRENVQPDRTYRLSFVVECKGSKEKPWVVFTSRLSRASWQEKIAYTVASRLGEVVLWNLLEDDLLRQAAVL